MIAQEMILEDGTRIVLVHFIYRSPRGTTRLEGAALVPVEYTWKISCAPNLLEFPAFGSRPFPYHRTDDARAVSCPLCKKTEEYQKAIDRLRAMRAAK